MPTATITPPGPILSASVTLTSAQVLAIFTTPVTIVPAPGAGLMLVLIQAVCNYHYGGTAYTDGGGNLAIRVGTLSVGPSFATAGFWDQSQSEVNYLAGSRTTTALSGLANQPMTVVQTGANPTLGNGTVTVTVAYMVVPVS